MSSAKVAFHPALVDPVFWNPKCKNYEIIDWEKWEANNPAPPKIFDPPQKLGYNSYLFTPLWWWNRSIYCQPIPAILHASCCAPKSRSGLLSEDKIYKEMLRPHPDSENIPEPLRDVLLWTENNIAPETLISFNGWAWRPQSEKGRTVGLGSLGFDWSSDPTCLGFSYAFKLTTRYGQIQASPNGKWLSLVTFGNPADAEGEVIYLYMYIVQEGDEFKTPDGKVMDYVKPGDLIRLTWGKGKEGPYFCDNDKLTYSYFPRKVAILDDNGSVQKNPLHYNELQTHATNKPGNCCETCCYTCACCMNGTERFDFQTSNISNLQYYEPAPEPPSSEVVDRL